MATAVKTESIARLATRIKKLNPSEQETLETMLDTEFAMAVLQRGKDIARLQGQKKLLSLEELREAFRL